jgi:hypothetical protein
MKRIAVALLLLPSFAYATPPDTQPYPIAASATADSNGSIKQQIDGVTTALALLLGQSDGVVAKLKAAVAAKPADTQRAIDDAARVLSSVADAASVNGELNKILTCARNAAVAHRKAVTDMPAGMLTEQGRTRILAAWDLVLKEADKTTASMADMHDQFLSVLKELRMHQTEIAELLLANQYQAALDTVTTWVNSLQGTVKQLHAIIADNPTS